MFIPGMLLMLGLFAVDFFLVVFFFLRVFVLPIFMPGMFFISCPAKMTDVNVKMVAIIAASLVLLLNCMIPLFDKCFARSEWPPSDIAQTYARTEFTVDETGI
jgi:hypothetical protein